MVEEPQQSKGGMERVPRYVSAWYFAGAVLVFAVTTLLIHQVHRHRTKASDGCLMDGDERVTLRGGALVGDTELPAEYRAELAETLRSGVLYRPAVAKPAGDAVKAAVRKPDAAFKLLTPVNVTIVSDQPLLDWEDLDDVEQYKVSIYDAAGHLVEESPQLSASAWRPVNPLERGQTYHWVVDARLGDRDVRVPGAGQAAATFVVAPQSVADQLLLAQAKYPDHHLLLATLFARAGDTQAARRELDLAEEQDGGHPMLARLKASLRQQ